MANRFHIKKGDQVVVISGDEKGKRGKVLEILVKKDRVIVEGLNLMKKHVKKSQNDPQGGIISREASLHVSNLMTVEKFDARMSKRVKTA